jgi:hypothetical protein
MVIKAIDTLVTEFAVHGMLGHGRVTNPTLLHRLIGQDGGLGRRSIVQMQVLGIGAVIQTMTDRSILGRRWQRRSMEGISNHHWFPCRSAIRRTVSMSVFLLLSQVLLQMHINRVGQYRLGGVHVHINDTETEEYGEKRRRDAGGQEGRAKDAILYHRNDVDRQGRQLRIAQGTIQAIPAILLLLLCIGIHISLAALASNPSTIPTRMSYRIPLQSIRLHACICSVQRHLQDSIMTQDS